MPIGGGTWWSGSDDKVSIDTIHRAYDLGINTIDTAPIYGLGHSEEVVGKAIAGQRDKYVISTKATFDWDTGEGPLLARGGRPQGVCGPWLQGHYQGL